jgi:hypothetical protein
MKRALILMLAAVTAIPFAACNDSNVPYYTAPTSVSSTPSGVQNAVSGLVSGLRGSDLLWYMVDQTGYARDGANYTNTEPRFILLELGLQSQSPAWSQVWSQFYPVVLQAHQIIATVPQVQPAYGASQSAALVGVVQTIEALGYMMIAEDHDTAGIAIMPQAPTVASPGYCIQDGWKYIVALLDSANNQLMLAGSTPLPVILPDGYKTVSASGTTFSAFNRALAGKAGLELAYAIARASAATAPGPNAAGQPDQAALIRADSAIKSSALYAPAALAPPTAGGFGPDGYSVLHNFSSTSGDLTNWLNQNIGTYVVLNTIPSSQDTLHDLRWRNKFIVNPNPVQQPAYASATSAYIYGMYPSPGSYIPIVRNEELNLVEAEIQIGLRHYATAANMINTVRMTVGGSGLKSGFQADTIIHSATDTLIVPAVDPNSYTSVRDFLLREQQISTAFEGSGDRMIAIRNYGLAAQVDTTWGAKDLHTVSSPVPFAEISARGGTFNKTCP